MRKTDNNIRSDCSVKRIATACMLSLLFRCCSLFVPHLRTLAQEERLQNCLCFGTGGQSLCLYQLLSQNFFFSPRKQLPLAQKNSDESICSRYAHTISEHY